MPTRSSDSAPHRPAGDRLSIQACDTHVHVFDPARIPYSPVRSYTPPAATVQDLRAFHRRLGLGRTVLVQASVYGTDNRCLLDALASLGSEGARGIAVIDAASIDRNELLRMHAQGVRGVRLNLEGRHAEPGAAEAAIRKLEALLAPLQWSLQMYADTSLLARLAPCLAGLSVPVVLDHFGGLKVASPTLERDIDAVLTLLAKPHIHVKLSAPYRLGATAPDYREAESIARALIAAAPDRLLWASDWPHTSSSQNRNGDLTQTEPFRREDAAHTLSLLMVWAGSAALATKILVDNPEVLYGFPASARCSS
jgi:predicted TIM-barrel fold metal-dependent hydrolase